MKDIIELVDIPNYFCSVGIVHFERIESVETESFQLKFCAVGHFPSHFTITSNTFLGSRALRLPVRPHFYSTQNTVTRRLSYVLRSHRRLFGCKAPHGRGVNSYHMAIKHKGFRVQRVYWRSEDMNKLCRVRKTSLLEEIHMWQTALFIFSNEEIHVRRSHTTVPGGFAGSERLMNLR